MSRVGPERRRGCSRRRDHGRRRRRRGALDGRHPSSAGLGTDHCVRRLDDPSPREPAAEQGHPATGFRGESPPDLDRDRYSRSPCGPTPFGWLRTDRLGPPTDRESGHLGPITDLRPRSSVVRAWGCRHTRSAHLGGAAAPSASGRASGEPTQRFPNGSFADPAHCVSRAPRLLAHRMMRSPIPRTDPSPSTRLVPA
jgi:hypothetical protein